MHPPVSLRQHNEESLSSEGFGCHPKYFVMMGPKFIETAFLPNSVPGIILSRADSSGITWATSRNLHMQTEIDGSGLAEAIASVDHFQTSTKADAGGGGHQFRI